jgi:hypothetical protein
MWANRVMFQIQCGHDNPLHVVRLTHKSPESVPAPRALHVSSTPGTTPEEGSIVVNYYTPATAIGKCENSRLAHPPGVCLGAST